MDAVWQSDVRNRQLEGNYKPPVFSLVDKLGTIVLPPRIREDVDDYMENFANINGHFEKHTPDPIKSMAISVVNGTANQQLPPNTYGEPIISIRMQQKKSRKRKK